MQNLQEFDKLAMKLKVLGAATPEDKFLLVTALREIGKQVLVTGDDIRDSSSMQMASISMASGCGSRDSHDIADTLSLDDNFANVIKAVADPI